ncbi:type II toxin-antitoxin system death-on-curing family toxin [Oerskovia flava]|uniref:type II toxin-antitoxin system death-on-curing family toxin n=1 Tax=Oerskovia flava TaxID=2986422 RepID=UPI00223FF556|nr:type II toxin-antitoxin system death-on-curing family toxin [Oerskovia sp. JB1-3-2]
MTTGPSSTGSPDVESVEYLELEDLLAAAAALLGSEPVVSDWGGLDSAGHRPRAAMFGQEAYPTLDLKAAALMLSVVQNHALVDGNKRLGLVAVIVFYGLNGSRFVAPHDDVFELTMSIADGTETRVSVVAERFAAWRR